MFSFHKPRVYRSTQGCCICKAKSSSSRFTDSKKYENDFMKCFQLTAPRRGEICNACVLLVKRFKRLPTGSDRHWGHVVDARVGPGLKSMTKFKKRKEESQQQKHVPEPVAAKNRSNRILIPEEFSKIFKKSKKKKFLEKRDETPVSSDDQSLPPSPTSFNNSDSEENQYGARRKSRGKGHLKITNKNLKVTGKKLNKRKNSHPRKDFRLIESTNFFDDKEWIRIKSCCGVVYENQELGALIMDENSILCPDHKEYFSGLNSQHLVSVSNEIKTENQQMSINNHNFNTIQSNLNRSIIVQNNETGNNHNNNNSNVQTTLPVLKKHHLFLKRQMESARIENVPNMFKTDSSSIIPATEYCVESTTQDVSLATDVSMVPVSTVNSANNRQVAYLHKTKLDAGKIVKHSIDKQITTRLKPSDMNTVKNLVKVKPVDEKLDLLVRNKQIDPTNNKFSDNSSDSGYEENLQEQRAAISSSNTVATSTLQQVYKGKVQSIVRPVILANGIKLHVQPQNLVLAANLAGLSQSAMQQPHAQITNKVNEDDDNRAIYNNSCSPSLISSTSSSPQSSPSPPHDGLAVSINGASAITQMVHTIPPGTNPKIILVKTKYSNNGNQATEANN